jgi:hypothetical protein
MVRDVQTVSLTPFSAQILFGNGVVCAKNEQRFVWGASWVEAFVPKQIIAARLGPPVGDNLQTIWAHTDSNKQAYVNE